MGGGVDPHRDDVGILAGDPVVHLEQVAVLLLDDVSPVSGDGIGEVEIDAVLERADAHALIDNGLGVAGGDVARDQVAERRVLLFEVVVALGLGNLIGPPLLVRISGDPNPAVVSQRLRHQGQLRLELVRGGDAGRVDLGVAGIGEVGALAVRSPGRGHV